MLEPIQPDNADRDSIRRAQKLCAQGRFLEMRWRQLEEERRLLSAQAEKLGQLAIGLSQLYQEARSGAEERESKLRCFVDDLSAIFSRLMLSDEPIPMNNVRQLADYVHQHAFEPATPLEDPARISVRVLCRQARYVVVYLGHAIQSRDTICLPRLADDLKRISSVIDSMKLKTLCDQFVQAAKSENWTAIQILHDELEAELSSVASRAAIDLAKAG